MTFDRISQTLAAAVLVAALVPVASAQEADKAEEKPDLAKRALDVLFESGAEKDADSEKDPRATKPEKSSDTEGAKPTEPAAEKPAATGTDGNGGTPGAPWPNKPNSETPSGPKPFVPPSGATGGDRDPVKPIPSDPPARGTGDAEKPKPSDGSGEPGKGTGTQAPPAPAPVTAKTYKIQSGDTFSSIAIKLYDDEKKWAAIAQANPLVDPTKLKIGQEIRLPDLARAAQDREAALRKAAEEVAAAGSDDTATPVTVTVQPGDTLSHIAHRVYGKARHWNLIFEANKDQLKDPGDVKVGQKLKIPPKPAEE